MRKKAAKNRKVEEILKRGLGRVHGFREPG